MPPPLSVTSLVQKSLTPVDKEFADIGGNGEGYDDILSNSARVDHFEGDL